VRSSCAGNNLQWSFVRNDQPKVETCTPTSLAIRDEVISLKAGIKPSKLMSQQLEELIAYCAKEEWAAYLGLGHKSISNFGKCGSDDTQIHTHMCYSEFNDTIQNIADIC
jgi:5-methyltetrahydropteroyltriglutamate--homocysteine methyltransferase